MTQKATIRVNLDTSQAKRQLRGLEKDGAATAGRINRRQRGGGGGSSFGMGAAIGTGAGFAMGAARRVGGGTLGDISGELTAGIRSRFDLAVGGPEARGKKRVREETIQNYAGAIAHGGATVNDALNYARQARPLAIKEEKAAAQLNSALVRDGAEDPMGDSSGLGGVFDRVILAIEQGFDKITGAVNGFGGR